MNPLISRLRGLLAFGVALGHLIEVARGSFVAGDAYFFVLDPWRSYLGFNCVIGFIVVSGYCIARSTLTPSIKFNLLRYFSMRVTRIYPALIVGACLAGAVELAFYGTPFRPPVLLAGEYSAKAFLIAFFGFSGFFGPFLSYGPSYTITFELTFYLLWGLAFFACRRAPWVAVPLSFAASVALYPVSPTALGLTMILYSAWLAGAALAIFEPEVTRITARLRPWMAWVLLYVGYTTMCVWFGLPTFEVSVGNWVYYTTLGLLFALVLACHLSQASESARFDDWLGDISYPLFLLHAPTMIAAASLIKMAGLQLKFGPFAVIVMGSVFLVAQAVLVFVERPIMNMRRRMKRRAMQPALAI